MRQIQVVECVQDVFKGVCQDLLESLDCKVSLIDDAEQIDDCPIACVDAGSDEIEFMIALQLPTAVLAMTYPVGDSITTIEENRLEDWISELSNQLVGRLKNKLIEHDCYVDLGLPTSYFGADVEQLLNENTHQASYYFDVDGEVCGCSVSIEVFDEALSFSIDVNEDLDLQEEGEMEFF